jgi:hypothetical protein
MKRDTRAVNELASPLVTYSFGDFVCSNEFGCVLYKILTVESIYSVFLMPCCICCYSFFLSPASVGMSRLKRVSIVITVYLTIYFA